jgi:predicted GNAT family N-acyltransferase
MFDNLLFIKWLFSPKSSGFPAILQQELYEAASHSMKEEVKKMEVRIATQADMSNVYKLTYQSYLKEHYCQENNKQELIHYPHLDNIEETTVIIVDEDGKIIGTNTVTLDGPNKLHTDEDFSEETERVRQECLEKNKKLGCSWRIVTSSDNRNNKAVICLLFNKTVEIMVDKAMDICLFIFNPKHLSFYHKIFGLELVTSNVCKSVSAPGVLMIGEVNTIRKNWAKISKRWGIPFKYNN